MEMVLLDLLKISPGLATCVIIVVVFLRHIGKSDKARARLQLELVEIIKENSVVIGETKEVLSKVEFHLEEAKFAKRNTG
jgi:hypothetical protein